jgi:hypothetical protein
MIETTSDKFTYCVLSPERIDENGDFQEGTAFGVGPETDPTGAYDSVFSISTDSYKILSMCIFEVCVVFALIN